VLQQTDTATGARDLPAPVHRLDHPQKQELKAYKPKLFDGDTL
jgi:hypothetical protein